MAAAVFLSLCSWKMLKQPLSHLLLIPEVIALTPTEKSSVPCQPDSVKALYKHLHWVLALLQAWKYPPETFSAQNCNILWFLHLHIHIQNTLWGLVQPQGLGGERERNQMSKWGEQGSFRAGKHEDKGESCFKQSLGRVYTVWEVRENHGWGKGKEE